MQKSVSRSCATAGIALVGAGIVAVAPVTVSPMASAVSPAVALTAFYDDMDLGGVIDQVRLGTLTLGGLLSGLGLSDEGMGDLLKLATNVGTLGELLDFLGMGDLGLSPYSLTALLGLDTDLYLDFYQNLDLDLELDNFRLVDVLSGFGISPEIPLGLGQLLVGLSDGSLADAQLGSLLSDVGLLPAVLGLLTSTGDPLLTSLVSGLLGADDLEAFLNNVTFGDLLGGLSIGEPVSSLLANLGGAVLSVGNLTVGGILVDLGVADSTAGLTLNDLSGGLGGVLIGGPLGLEITGLLNGLDLGGLVGFLGLDDLSLNLGGLVGDWVNPYLADLLEGLAQVLVQG
ncbi:hypothetical protein [Mycolicibacter longobardus]|uniref:Uncharacterized protein n=1 Tax=Mycolicibacter longobardus TaxID=1108812 RepID=A0A1X1YFL3_9MYCO|nr:hypothetical protein [Mycolicibacter longobardus]MCV7384780.1 hypothetical protein [Mycolicibacter longobardus]ORW09888.1 hypothetical protein AWC16_15310 [Mycolicibacter longobardus]